MRIPADLSVKIRWASWADPDFYAYAGKNPMTGHDPLGAWSGMTLSKMLIKPCKFSSAFGELAPRWLGATYPTSYGQRYLRAKVVFRCE